MSPRGKEKKPGQQAEHRVTLRTVSDAGLGTIEVETSNLTLGGTTCLSDRAIPSMTRLQLNIFLPSTDGRPAHLHYPIEVDAVVVDSVELSDSVNSGDDEAAYRLSLYFAGMATKDRQLLSRYLRCVEPT